MTTKIDQLFIARNARDTEMLELYSTYKGHTILWATAHCDILASLKTEVAEHFEAADGELEIVIISREFYDALMAGEKTK